MIAMIDDSAPCPCGRPGPPPGGPALTYAACCARWHTGPLRLQAPDAEALMRSRYSAYVLGLADYLLATWHPATRPTTLAPNEPGLKWLGLEVRRHEVQDSHHASVEFVARSKWGGRAQRLHETSRFERWSEASDESPRWVYRDGDLQGA